VILYLVGVTGKVASGKGEVCRYFGKLGAAVVNADEVAAEMMGKRDSASLIKAEFGDEVMDENGNIDRKWLARMVFSNKNKLRKLNENFLPMIADLIKQHLKKISEHEDIVILEAPLLFQAKLDSLCDFVIMIKSNRNNRIKRLILNRGMESQEAILRVNGQNLRMPEKKADLVIDNNGSLNELFNKAKEAYSLIERKASRKLYDEQI